MRVPWRQWARTFHDKRYYVHALGYLAIIKWKKITDTINEPIKMKTGHWTELVYSIEGDFTKWIQDAFQNDVLTDFLNFHYLFVYLFLIAFAFLLISDSCFLVVVSYLTSFFATKKQKEVNVCLV
jgi:hypothetical protein